MRNMLCPGVSSMNSFEPPKMSPASMIFVISSSTDVPLRKLWLSTMAWQQSRRSANSMRACSRLTNKTGKRSSTTM